MRIKEYDLIVLGTGDAGLTVALAAAKERWKVAIIEKKAIGGTCALWGCVPKKVLISGEELANFSQRMAAAGLSSKTTPDWSEIMAFKLRLTGSFSQGSRSNLQKKALIFMKARLLLSVRLPSGWVRFHCKAPIFTLRPAHVRARSVSPAKNS